MKLSRGPRARLAAASRSPFATVPFLAFAAALEAQTAAAPRHLRDVLAGDALAYVEAPDFQATLQRGKDIPVVRILREEEFQQSPGSALANGACRARARTQGDRREAGELAIVPAQVGRARGRAAHGRAACWVLRAHRDRQARRRDPSKGGATRSQTIRERDDRRWRDAHHSHDATQRGGRDGGRLDRHRVHATDRPGRRPRIGEAANQGLRSGDAKNTLSADPQYQALTSKLQTKNPEWIVYLKPAAIFEELEQTLRGPGAAGSRPATRAGGKGASKKGSPPRARS